MQHVFHGTAVQPFAVDGHRRCHDDFLEPRAHAHRFLEDNSRTDRIHGRVALDLVHGLPDADGCRKMKEAIDALQCFLHGVVVANVAFDPLDVVGEIVGPAAVNLGIERVEHPHHVASRKQTIDAMRADEAGATRDQDSHLFGGYQARRRRAAQRHCRAVDQARAAMARKRVPLAGAGERVDRLVNRQAALVLRRWEAGLVATIIDLRDDCLRQESRLLACLGGS